LKNVLLQCIYEFLFNSSTCAISGNSNINKLTKTGKIVLFSYYNDFF